MVLLPTGSLIFFTYDPISLGGNKADVSWDDPTNRIWSIYTIHAKRRDEALAASWKVDTDGVLIYVRLPVPMIADVSL